MESYNVNRLKTAKKNEILKSQQLRKMASFLRLIEVCVFLVLISRLSSHLPVAVKNSGEYFRDISVVLVSPRFMFFIGNLIVITLFAKSGQFSRKNSDGKGPEAHLNDEFVNKSLRSNSIEVPDFRYKSKASFPETHSARVLEINYQNKKSFPKSDHSPQVPKTKHWNKMSFSEESSVSRSVFYSGGSENYRRSQSENLNASHNHYHSQSNRPSQPLFRRSKTEKCMKSTVSSSKRSVKNSHPEDKMSNEEFCSVVEAFIARQQRMRLEEEYYAK